jgi:hypothetical protein
MSAAKTKWLLSSVQQISHVDCDQCLGRLWWWGFCSRHNRVITTGSASVQRSDHPPVTIQARTQCALEHFPCSCVLILIGFVTLSGRSVAKCAFSHMLSSGSCKGGDFLYELFQFVLTSWRPNALNKNTGAETDAVEDVGLEVPQRIGNIRWCLDTKIQVKIKTKRQLIGTKWETPWPESASELYRPSDRHSSAKLVSTACW